MHNVRLIAAYALFLAGTTFTLFQLLNWDMGRSKTIIPLLWLSLVDAQINTPNLSWHAPRKTWINDLSEVINGTGTHGFIFNSSQLPPGTPYSAYNWCNMPHVRRQEYPKAMQGYTLEYVEVVRKETVS